MKRRTHPDSHALDDWPLYGPKNPEIARLVDCLAHDHMLRVNEIEEIILTALKSRLKKAGAVGSD
ncbi:hypothetical protein [Jannaschia sp. 2305UL9-9]|uniref:hypothetical protein n=1 Tax=Jannaschia sp. 2305UL9-9 TaxID=3121638 RepID=UPI0035298ADB